MSATAQTASTKHPPPNKKQRTDGSNFDQIQVEVAYHDRPEGDTRNDERALRTHAYCLLLAVVCCVRIQHSTYQRQ